jgi:diguanylate cyclase (GGDEF)-like protein
MIGTYNGWLVLLSLFMAMLASYLAFDLASRIAVSTGRSARLWLAGSGLCMGAGVWATHMLGMLALDLPFAVGFGVSPTLLSMLAAVGASGLGLYLASRGALNRLRLSTSGVSIGLGIVAAQYLGTASMAISASLRYDLGMLAAATGIAVAASVGAVWLGFTARDRAAWWLYAKIGSATLMSAAIAGMHYTAMVSARFAPDAVPAAGAQISAAGITVAVAAVAFAIMCVNLVLSAYDSHLASKTARMATSLKSANEELQRTALHDTLTKLPNRILLEDRIGQAIVSARRSGEQCAVLFVDLDRFKIVNDSLGHFAGDELLKAVAQRLRSVVRGEDTVSRLGGDEFVVLLRAISKTEDAATVAGKILESLKVPVSVQGRDLPISLSIGISIFPTHGEAGRELIANADAAMYQAKKSGRNQFQFFGAEMETFYSDLLSLEIDLRHALDRGEFELHYQPKFNVETEEIAGWEALLRWRHPKKGLIKPDEFMPLADDTGLIVPIGEWMLREVCAQTRAWQRQGLPGLRTAVNISGVQLRQKGMVSLVERALLDNGLAPESLELEITESVVMQDVVNMGVVLGRLRRMGVQIAIDDFGTGYSSLAYLKRLPIHTVKVDRSFVRDVARDPDDAAIVSAIVALAHNLRLKVIAEGVEHPTQLEFLRSLGVDEYQGYLRSRPLSAEDLARFLATPQGKGGRTHMPLPAPVV